MNDDRLSYSDQEIEFLKIRYNLSSESAKGIYLIIDKISEYERAIAKAEQDSKTDKEEEDDLPF